AGSVLIWILAVGCLLFHPVSARANDKLVAGRPHQTELRTPLRSASKYIPIDNLPENVYGHWQTTRDPGLYSRTPLRTLYNGNFAWNIGSQYPASWQEFLHRVRRRVSQILLRFGYFLPEVIAESGKVSRRFKSPSQRYEPLGRHVRDTLLAVGIHRIVIGNRVPEQFRWHKTAFDGHLEAWSAPAIAKNDTDRLNA